MHKRSSRQSNNANRIAKSIPDLARASDSAGETHPIKNQAAVELGRLGGLKGGKARAEKLSPEERKDIARQAALARWKK